MIIPNTSRHIVNEPEAVFAGTQVIGTLRFMLASTAILTILLDSAAVWGVPRFAWLIFFFFSLHHVVLYAIASTRVPAPEHRFVLWLDVGWYSAMVYVTGGGSSLFFPFYVFTILIGAFRFGFGESMRITLVSTAMFSLTALAASDPAELAKVLLRSSFLLALGYLIAQWGESNLTQKRSLSLLRSVSRLSNPRFGISRTIELVMEQSREFFSASSCILVTHRPKSRRWLLRTTTSEGILDTPVPAAAAVALMAMPDAKIMVYNKPLFRWARRTGMFRAYDPVRRTWDDCQGNSGQQIAEQLEARSFISVPLVFCEGVGRVYVTSANRAYGESDALFLGQIVDQVLPMIENVHFLDRMASLAALRERKMISRDLHDSAVQPYIGLNHSLSALRNKAGSDNPLSPDIDALSNMTAQVVSELRGYAGNFARQGHALDDIVNSALRRHVLHAKQCYGIDIVLDIGAGGRIGDRLAAAVLQLAREGISNICKHTQARRGALRISCHDGWLHMEIENDRAGPPREFVPASITDRSAALGGTARVEQHSNGTTIVRIDIPV